MSDHSKLNLDHAHHVAIPVKDVARAVQWYQQQFQCHVSYQDETWAMLDFANIQIALVVPKQHPPHVAFTSSKADQLGELTTHRDGVRSLYIQDTEGNAVEFIDPTSLPSSTKNLS